MNILATDRTEFGVKSVKGGCTGESESIHVKMPRCWKSHVAAHLRKNRKRYCQNTIGCSRGLMLTIT